MAETRRPQQVIACGVMSRRQYPGPCLAMLRLGYRILCHVPTGGWLMGSRGAIDLGFGAAAI